ncbi:hypothetical protein [Hydrogenispora ethanolica]|nr:hypothetical protein [Hydrogenispora ethanolica]
MQLSEGLSLGPLGSCSGTQKAHVVFDRILVKKGDAFSMLLPILIGEKRKDGSRSPDNFEEFELQLLLRAISCEVSKTHIGQCPFREYLLVFPEEKLQEVMNLLEQHFTDYVIYFEQPK